jgi:NADPH:quinone reductase-like Zn-dependent oxidoreductase
MKAVVCTRYGPPDVLELKEIAKPAPKSNELLIRIHATTVTSGDCRIRSLNTPRGFGLISRFVLGLSKPKRPILGTELAGEVTQVGDKVTRFKVGDEVFALCGSAMGCYAEYVCLREESPVVQKPANLTYDEAAALPFGGTTALHFLSRGKLREGERVLINGASGGVGTAAVQIAKFFGAEVTAVCSAANADMVRTLGAARVVDYTKEDFTKHGETYDVIVDTVGTAPFSRCKGSLREGGRLLLVLATLPQMLQIPWVSMIDSKQIIAGPAPERAADLLFLADLAEAGAFTPVIDRCYPLEEIVEAHRYVDVGHKRGNVVIRVAA